MAEPFVPPPGTENDDLSGQFQGFVIAMTVMVVLSITLRFWSRSLIVRGNLEHGVGRFWWDDWVALAALPFILAQFGIEFEMVQLGLGHHIWTISPSNLSILLKLLYAIYFLYDVSLFLTKTSALLFFSRVFPKYGKASWFDYALWTTHGLNVAWFVGIIFGTVFMCNPVAKGWDPFLPGTCGPTSALWIGSAIPSVVIDLIILTLPLPKIWGLNMNKKRKMGLTFVFLLGYCVIIVSLGRMITLLTSGEGLNTDLSYLGVPVSIWVSAEAPVIVLCICLPAMLPLGRHLATNYYTPLATRLSSMLSSGGRTTASGSKSRDLSSAIDTTSQGIRLRNAKKDSNGRSYNSIDSERGFLPTTQYKYDAGVTGGQNTEQNKNIPHLSIQVERKYDVNQLEH